MLTPAEIVKVLNGANVHKIENGAVPQTGPGFFEQSKFEMVRSLLSYVGGSPSATPVQQAQPRSVTILTNNVTLKQYKRPQGQKGAVKGVKLCSKGVGIWTVSLGSHFELNIVHTRLRNAWNRLQADGKINLRTVTHDICAQAEEKRPDGSKLTELYLLRACLALRLWFETNIMPSKSRKLNWCEMTAVSFVDPYAARANNSGKHGITKAPRLGVERDEQVLSWSNAVLLQVASPFTGK